MNNLNFDPIIITQALVKCASITPKDEGALDIVENHLSYLGFKCTRLPFSDPSSYDVDNLFATIGSNGKHLAFAGHTDVVPPGNLKDWTIDPFKPVIKKNYLIGRGANDMKSSIACFISAVNKFLKKKSKFKGSISLLITGDEEGPAINGTKKVVNYLKKRERKLIF